MVKKQILSSSDKEQGRWVSALNIVLPYSATLVLQYSKKGNKSNLDKKGRHKIIPLFK
jgi:hypothetical protein